MAKKAYVAAATAAIVTAVIAMAARGLAQAPGSPGSLQAATGTITIEVDGKPIGTASVVNLQSNTGIVQGCSFNSSMSRLDCLPALDSAFALTRPTDLRSTDHYLNFVQVPPCGTCSTFAAETSPPLDGYSVGEFWTATFPVPCPANATIDIQSLGPLPLVTKTDTGTARVQTCLAGIPYTMLIGGPSGGPTYALIQ